MSETKCELGSHVAEPQEQGDRRQLNRLRLLYVFLPLMYLTTGSMLLWQAYYGDSWSQWITPVVHYATACFCLWFGLRQRREMIVQRAKRKLMGL